MEAGIDYIGIEISGNACGDARRRIAKESKARKGDIIEVVKQLGAVSQSGIRKALAERSPSKVTLRTYIRELIAEEVLQENGSDPSDRRQKLLTLTPGIPG